MTSESRAIELRMMGYIRERLNYVLKFGNTLYCQGKESNDFETGFVRKEEWDCEKFGEHLNMIAKDDEQKLNAVKSGTHFTISMRMIHDKVHKDGLSRKFIVKFSWEPVFNNPFDDMYGSNDRYKGKRTVCDDEDSDDEFETVGSDNDE